MIGKIGLIKRIHSMLKSKEISCKELTQKYLDAIKKSELNAYVNVCTKTALKTANKVDEKIQNSEEISPLSGIPMTLKDLISTEGIETTCCSKILKGYVPIFDATVWKLLKNQGAVLLGKTNMDEFAMGSSGETSCIGAVHNPHNLNHVPGGSSSGTAAAVGGNVAVYGLASDTGGSIRMPSSFCGLVGLKPTYGSVSRYGAIAYASSLDQIGPIAKTTEDTALVFDAISGYDPKDSTSNPNSKLNTYAHLKNDIKNIKIGIPNEYFEGLNSEVKITLENALKIYESMGAQIEYINLPELKYALPVYYILACAEATSNLARFDGIRYGHKTTSYENINEMICKTRNEGFGPEVKRRILLGNYVLHSGFYDAYYKKALNLRVAIVNAFNKVFEKFDVLFSPTAPITAPEFGKISGNPVEAYLTDVCNVPINIAGLPAISVPCGFDSKNLPIGMQIIGPKFSEAKLLNAGHQFELFTNFSHCRDLDMGVKI